MGTRTTHSTKMNAVTRAYIHKHTRTSFCQLRRRPPRRASRALPRHPARSDDVRAVKIQSATLLTSAACPRHAAAAAAVAVAAYAHHRRARSVRCRRRHSPRALPPALLKCDVKTFLSTHPVPGATRWPRNTKIHQNTLAGSAPASLALTIL